MMAWRACLDLEWITLMDLKPRTADRNLIAVLLALRLGFLKRETLDQSIADGSARSSEPIGSLWLEQGAIDRAKLAVVESLVDEMLGLHDQDPEKCLATLDPEGRFGQGASAYPTLLDSLVTVAPLADPAETQMATRLGLASLDKTDQDLYATAAPTLADDSPQSTGDARSGGETGTRQPTTSHQGRRYRNLKQHAKGGLGAVFLAEDLELRREVALKEILDRHADHPEHRARFLLEAEVTGCLEHPGIVPIYGLGQDHDGRPYYAMRFVEGETLRAAIQQHRDLIANGVEPGAKALSLRRLLKHFVAICEAIAYAHSRGVIHRDIKPDNVMLGLFGETLVLDWGLAKPLGRCFLHEDSQGSTRFKPLPVFGDRSEEARSHTLAASSGQASARVPRPLILSSQNPSSETIVGSAIGTPAYMPPEQAQGDINNLGPHSDIYSLGATIYHIITGQAPFQDRDLATLFAKLNQGDFPTPSRVDATVPKALEAIVLKAMAVQPEARYQTAKALGDDVERWLADEPVSVYHEPWNDRLRRWGRRHRTAVTTASALLVLSVVALSIGASLLERERARTDRERMLALANYRLAYDAADKMLGEVAEVELADIPQMEPVRRRLLETARSRFSDLLDQESRDPEVRLLAARNQVRLGDVLSLMGRYKTAEISYREALQGFQTLLVRLPDHDSLPSDWAHAHEGLGILLRKINRFRDSETHLRRAIELLTKEAVDTPDDLEIRKRLADCRYNLGALLARQSRRGPEDEKTYQQAITDQETLLNAAVDESESIEKLARYRNNLAILEARSRPAQAERRFREILESLRKLEPPARRLPWPRWQEARASNNLSALLMRDPARSSENEADTLLDAARKFLETLVAEFPRIPQYRRELASVDANQGRRALTRKTNDEAAARFRSAAELLEKLTEEDPEIPDYRQQLAVNLSDLALLMASSNADEADRDFERSIHVQEQLVANFPDVPDYRNALGRGLYNLGKILVERGDPRKARDHLERAVEEHQEILKSDTGNEVFRKNLFEDRGLLMTTLIRLGDPELAARLAEQLPATLPEEVEAYLRAAAGLTACSAIDATRRDDFAASAVKILDLAFDKGLPIRPEILDRPEFASIRNRGDFNRLRKRLSESPNASVSHPKTEPR